MSPGGFKLQLLDENEKFSHSLTSPGEDDTANDAGWILGDPTAQSHRVTIPRDVECQGCTVREAAKHAIIQ